MDESLFQASVILLGILIALDRIRSLTITFKSADGKDVVTKEEREEFESDIKSKVEDMANTMGENTVVYAYTGILGVRLLLSIGFIFGAFTLLSGFAQWIPLLLLITDSLYTAGSIRDGVVLIRTGISKSFSFTTAFHICTIVIVGVSISLLFSI